MPKSKTAVCDEDRCVNYMKPESCPFSACGVPIHGCEYADISARVAEMEKREEGWGDIWDT